MPDYVVAIMSEEACAALRRTLVTTPYSPPIEEGWTALLKARPATPAEVRRHTCNHSSGVYGEYMTYCNTCHKFMGERNG